LKIKGHGCCVFGSITLMKSKQLVKSLINVLYLDRQTRKGMVAAITLKNI
jgi:hypothetical protein